MLLAPSSGFGGGIERVATAVEHTWPGPVTRVDLYRRSRDERASGGVLTKLGFGSRALRAAQRDRPDIVLAIHVGLLPVAVIVASGSRARVALLGIGTEVWSRLSAATRVLIRSCDRLMAISAFTADLLARQSGVDRERIAVIALPVDERILKAAQAFTDPGGRQPHLLTVSRVVAAHRYKGHFAIAESLPQVLAQRPDARWIVVGDGDDLPALQSKCTLLGISDAVSFERLLTDEQLAELYGCAAALVLPSVTDLHRSSPTGEGFGLVYAEAASFGVPSVASTAAGGAAEFVVDGENGLTVAPGDRAGLASAMLQLLDDTALRDRLGRGARERALSRNTSARFLDELTEALATRR